MDGTIEAIYDNILNSLLTNHLLWKVALFIVCFFSLFSLLRAWRNHYKRDWDSFYFILLSISIFVWGLFTLLAFVAPTPELAETFNVLSPIGMLFVPGFLCLHIWRQVSYKDVTWQIVILFLAVPTVLSVLPIFNLFNNSTFNIRTSWVIIIFYLYAAVMLMRAFLLCFNVFYQMPRHMRKSSYYLLAGIMAATLGFTIELLFPSMAEYLDIPLVASTIMLFFFTDAFRAASSANVIVTSRDFVFSNLSTMILVLSHKNRILDWNRKDISSLKTLPEPLYKESFQNYRMRIIKDGDGRVSPHGENIITTQRNSEEQHYLITIHEVGQEGRDLGYIAEISEVTKLYTIIRYLEDIATMDQLTGLFNRNTYLTMVQTLLQQPNMPLLVMVGDVNNLKQLNDVHGHLNGDQLLTTVASLIKKHAPSGAFTARIGGDEFVVLMSRGNEEAAKTFIQDVQQDSIAMQEEFFGVPSISWGYALMHSTAEDYNEVFAKADQMMYADKKENSKFRSSGFVPPNTAGPSPTPLAAPTTQGVEDAPEGGLHQDAHATQPETSRPIQA